MITQTRDRITIAELPGYSSRRWRFTVNKRQSLTDGNLQFRYDPAEYPTSRNYRGQQSFWRLPTRIQKEIDRLLLLPQITRFYLTSAYVEVDVGGIQDWEVVQPTVVEFLRECYHLVDLRVKYNCHHE